MLKTYEVTLTFKNEAIISVKFYIKAENLDELYKIVAEDWSGASLIGPNCINCIG